MAAITDSLQAMSGVRFASASALPVEAGVWDQETWIDMLLLRFWCKVSTAPTLSTTYRAACLSVRSLYHNNRRDPIRVDSDKNRVHCQFLRADWFLPNVEDARRLLRLRLDMGSYEDYVRRRPYRSSDRHPSLPRLEQRTRVCCLCGDDASSYALDTREHMLLRCAHPVMRAFREESRTHLREFVCESSGLLSGTTLPDLDDETTFLWLLRWRTTRAFPQRRPPVIASWTSKQIWTTQEQPQGGLARWWVPGPTTYVCNIAPTPSRSWGTGWPLTWPPAPHASACYITNSPRATRSTRRVPDRRSKRTTTEGMYGSCQCVLAGNAMTETATSA